MASKDRGNARGTVRDADVHLLRDLLDVADREQDADGSKPQPDLIYSDHAVNDEVAHLLEHLATRGALFRLRDAVMPDEEDRRRIVAASDPRAMFGWSDALSARGYDWWRSPQSFETYMSERNRLIVMLRAMDDRLPRSVPADLRIEANQAIEFGAPDHGLPPTPKSTFYRWGRKQKNWPRLGIERRDGWKVQPVLVSGLLQMHASDRRKTKLPASAPNAGRARRSSSRKGRGRKGSK